MHFNRKKKLQSSSGKVIQSFCLQAVTFLIYNVGKRKDSILMELLCAYLYCLSLLFDITFWAPHKILMTYPTDQTSTTRLFSLDLTRFSHKIRSGDGCVLSLLWLTTETNPVSHRFSLFVQPFSFSSFFFFIIFFCEPELSSRIMELYITNVWHYLGQMSYSKKKIAYVYNSSKVTRLKNENICF